jgi:hypothetical protein
VRATSELVVTTAGIVWLDPPSAPFAIGLAVAMVAVPLLFQPPWSSAICACAATPAGWPLLPRRPPGLVPIRAHAGEEAMKREHGERLLEWARAAWAGAAPPSPPRRCKRWWASGWPPGCCSTTW